MRRLASGAAVGACGLAASATTPAPVAGCGGRLAETKFACRNDSPPPGVQGVEGDQACTLPDGGQGIGSGGYGCIDPNVCHCIEQAGPASCAPGVGDTFQLAVHCVYAACNSANQDRICALPGGGEGICCGTTCSASVPPPAEVTPPGFVNDTNNCGGCGQVCPSGSTCDGTSLCSLPCPMHACPAGMTCIVQGLPISRTTGMPSPIAFCMLASCALQPDGVRCSADGHPGMCCNGECVDTTKDCGGCGMPCCAGTQCGPYLGIGVTGVCLTPT